MDKILREGIGRGDRTGTGTLSIFGHQMRFDLSEGFPLVTTKRIWFKGLVHELLWFLSGDTNVRYLQQNKVHIWDPWADQTGELGPVYGAQWRKWPAYDGGYIDQIAEVIESIKTHPDSRRHVVSAWNVGQLAEMALPPCHGFFQFYVGNGRLSCQLYQRSVDTVLGLPFNIAEYSLLTHMLAQQCSLEPGELIWTGGDCHIYLNHLEAAKRQSAREPRPLPQLRIKRRPSTMFDYRLEDFELMDYEPHPHIKAEISV
jgi:thymidylate synthase